jgi:hypothetical protein
MAKLDFLFSTDEKSGQQVKPHSENTTWMYILTEEDFYPTYKDMKNVR